jgi:hypothetical protein
MEKRELNSTHGSKFCAASLLILGMEGLRPGRLLPISQAAIGDAGSVNAALDRQRIGAALTSAVLYAVVVELVVKHMWEQEHGKTAEHSHDVHRLFRALSSQTQRDVEALYNNCCVEYKASVQAGTQQHGSGAVAVDMANLEEALQWNQGAVKDLKYEMTPRGRSVPTGLFWDSDHVWVVPSAFPNFAIELARWAARHSFKRLTP